MNRRAQPRNQRIGRSLLQTYKHPSYIHTYITDMIRETIIHLAFL